MIKALIILAFCLVLAGCGDDSVALRWVKIPPGASIQHEMDLYRSCGSEVYNPYILSPIFQAEPRYFDCYRSKGGVGEFWSPEQQQ